MRDFARKFLTARSAAGSSDARDGGFIARMLAGLQTFQNPVLFLLSERDLTARQFQDLAESSDAWRAAMQRPNVAVEHLAGADHTFSTRQALDAANGRCLAWLSEISGRAAHPAGAASPRTAAAR
jgi:hypothetical protein